MTSESCKVCPVNVVQNTKMQLQCHFILSSTHANQRGRTKTEQTVRFIALLESLKASPNCFVVPANLVEHLRTVWVILKVLFLLFEQSQWTTYSISGQILEYSFPRASACCKVSNCHLLNLLSKERYDWLDECFCVERSLRQNAFPRCQFWWLCSKLFV